MHLAHERVDVDHQPLLARPGTRLPSTPQRLGQHPVELAHVPERERAQERPQRRGRHHTVTTHQTRAARAQQVAVVDRVGAQKHRVHQRQHLPPRPRRRRPTGQIDRLVDQRLDSQPLGQRRRQHQSRVGDRTLVVELNPQSVQHHARPIVHHTSDLLTQAAAAPYSHFLPAQEVILRPQPDANGQATRWIEAQCDRTLHPAQYWFDERTLSVDAGVRDRQRVHVEELGAELHGCVRDALELIAEFRHEVELSDVVDEKTISSFMDRGLRPDRPPGREE